MFFLKIVNVLEPSDCRYTWAQKVPRIGESIEVPEWGRAVITHLVHYFPEAEKVNMYGRPRPRSPEDYQGFVLTVNFTEIHSPEAEFTTSAFLENPSDHGASPQ